MPLFRVCYYGDRVLSRSQIICFVVAVVKESEDRSQQVADSYGGLSDNLAGAPEEKKKYMSGQRFIFTRIR